MISSVGSSTASLSIASVQQNTGTGATSTTSSVGGAQCAGDSAQISGPGKLFSELKQLAASDPAKFKTVAADIAAKLKEAAGTAGTSSTATTAAAGGSPLADLAAKFQQAADTGDVSVLQPPAGGGHGGHHHHHGVGTYNQQGQVQPTSATPAASGSNGVDLKSLFDSISNEVSSALGS